MKMNLKHLFFTVSAFFAINCQAQMTQTQLPNGWKLSPIGKQIPLEDLPLNIIISPNKKYAAITNNGQSNQGIHLFDLSKNQIIDYVTTPKSWYGLAFSGDSQSLYASGGNDNWILQYKIVTNKLKLVDSISLGAKWPVKISPTTTGLIPTGWGPTRVALSNDEKHLYITSCRGLGAGPNGGKHFKIPKQGTYIGDVQLGGFQDVVIPDNKRLADYTKMVLNNTYTIKEQTDSLPLPVLPGSNKSPIKHIVYITKENRQIHRYREE